MISDRAIPTHTVPLYASASRALTSSVSSRELGGEAGEGVIARRNYYLGYRVDPLSISNRGELLRGRNYFTF